MGGIPRWTGLGVWTAVGLLVAGCGGTGDAPIQRDEQAASQWAEGFCRSVITVFDEIDAVLVLLGPELALGIDTTATEAALQRAAESLQEASAELAALTPPAEAQAYQQGWRAFFRDAEVLVRDSLDASGALSRTHAEFKTDFVPLIVFPLRDLAAMAEDSRGGLRAALDDAASCSGFSEALEGTPIEEAG